MTYIEFKKLGYKERIIILRREYEELTFARKDPMIHFIDFAKQLQPYDNHWSVYKFTFNRTELAEKCHLEYNRISHVTIGGTFK